ncbi:MAG: anthranilate synthase component I [Streptosporangiales bacterium]|nr:anthranilate synthase component I [Streptosporangiales bacterium]
MISSEVSPDRETFRALAGQPVVPVMRRVLADAETPLGLYTKLTSGRRGTFLLESAEHEPIWSRYSVIGVHCPAMLTEHGGRAVWLGDPPPLADAPSTDPFAAVQATLNALRHPGGADLPPFTGGLVGYVGYDIVRGLEPLPSSAVDDLDLPQLALMFATDVAVLDHHDGSVVLIANAFHPSEVDTEASYDDAVARLETMTTALGTRPPPSVAVYDRQALSSVVSRTPPGEFPKALQRAQEHVREGDCYLVTLGQRFEAATTASPLDVYRLLRAANPGPYLYLLDFGEFHVIGSSPVEHVNVTGGRATVRTVAGTRPRGAAPEEDTGRAAALIDDPVARAEHVTLVDASRGDLCRVCVPGSVQLAQFMEVERYRQAMCLASTVVGQLAPDRTAFDVFAATFPAYGRTGAPKVRAMQLIEDLEPTRRGPYGGGVGYFGLTGDFNLAAMAGAAVIRDGRAHVQAGATVTVGTDPEEAERASREEAAAVFTALAVAETLEPPP